MKTVYIGLGSNLENPIMQIQEAVDRLREVPGVTINKLSSLYRSKPMGPQDQPDFINAVAEIETNLSAIELLQFLKRIEDAQKRVDFGKRWGPRTIDLDILVFGNETIDQSDLQVPHPGLSQREFVVYPLAEIAPYLILPSGEKIIDLKERCPLRGLSVLPIKESEMA